MADEKRIVRTAGVAGTFVLSGLLQTEEGPADLVITPEGTEVTREQWEAVAKAATENHVIVRLDEDFPVAEAQDPKTAETASGDAGENKEQVQTQDTGTAVDGTETPTSSSTGGTTRKGR